MGKAAAKTTTQKSTTSKTAIGGWPMALQLADTTWRVALPLIVLSYVGIRLDRKYSSEPLLSLVGLFAALLLAGVLVYRQIRLAYPEFGFKAKAERGQKK